MIVFTPDKVSKLHNWQFYFNENVTGNVPGKITVNETI